MDSDDSTTPVSNTTGTSGGSTSGLPLPEATPTSTAAPEDPDATTTNAAYRQNPGGILLHPDLKGGAPITSGVMNVIFAPTLLSLTVSGMTTTKSEAKKGVAGMNGKTVFDKVKYANLPDAKNYKDHSYLIFARAVTNNDNQKFTTTGSNLMPIYAVAKDTVEAYDNLLRRGILRYPVTVVGPDGSQVPVTFTVTRALDGYLPSCPSHPFESIAKTLEDADNYMGVKITVTGIPQNWLGKFPMTDAIYVNKFAGGGSTKAIATCREIYDSERRKRGSVKLEFAQ